MDHVLMDTRLGPVTPTYLPLTPADLVTKVALAAWEICNKNLGLAGGLRWLRWLQCFVYTDQTRAAEDQSMCVGKTRSPP